MFDILQKGKGKGECIYPTKDNTALPLGCVWVLPGQKVIF